jgi:hypothetical protein
MLRRIVLALVFAAGTASFLALPLCARAQDADTSTTAYLRAVHACVILGAADPGFWPAVIDAVETSTLPLSVRDKIRPLSAGRLSSCQVAQSYLEAASKETLADFAVRDMSSFGFSPVLCPPVTDADRIRALQIVIGVAQARLAVLAASLQAPPPDPALVLEGAKGR